MAIEATTGSALRILPPESLETLRLPLNSATLRLIRRDHAEDEHEQAGESREEAHGYSI